MFFEDPSIRFIPAGAGNSGAETHGAEISAVHPRGCGEQSCAGCAGCAVDGSSPRVRGTGAAPAFKQQFSRFIPAGAGNRLNTLQIHVLGKVHPRGCGEQVNRGFQEIYMPGSSPRVRGTVCPGGNLCQIRWFIPAGAGNSSLYQVPPEWCQVHPRGCGEQTDHRQEQRRDIGSSPRVRGTER